MKKPANSANKNKPKQQHRCDCDEWYDDPKSRNGICLVCNGVVSDDDHDDQQAQQQQQQQQQQQPVVVRGTRRSRTANNINNNNNTTNSQASNNTDSLVVFNNNASETASAKRGGRGRGLGPVNAETKQHQQKASSSQPEVTSAVRQNASTVDDENFDESESSDGEQNNAILRMTHGDYIDSGFKPSCKKAESASKSSLTQYEKKKLQSFIAKFSTAEKKATINDVPIKVCPVCYQKWYGSARNNRIVSHIATCDGDDDDGKKENDEDEKAIAAANVNNRSVSHSTLDQIATDMYSHAKIAGSEVEAVFQVLIHRLPSIFAHASTFTTNFNRTFMVEKKDHNNKTQDSLLLAEVHRLDSYLANRLSKVAGLTIMVDGGSESNLHLIVTAAMYKGQVNILRPIVTNSGTSEEIYNAVEKSLGFAECDMKNLACIVIDSAAPMKKFACDLIDEVLKKVTAKEEDEASNQEHERPESVDRSKLEHGMGEFLFNQNKASGDAVRSRRILVMICLGHYFHNTLKWVMEKDNGDVSRLAKQLKDAKNRNPTTVVEFELHELPVFNILALVKPLFASSVSSPLSASKLQEYRRQVNQQKTTLLPLDLYDAAVAKVTLKLQNDAKTKFGRLNVLEELFRNRSSFFPDVIFVGDEATAKDQIILQIKKVVYPKDVQPRLETVKEPNFHDQQLQEFTNNVKAATAEGRRHIQSQSQLQTTVRFGNATRYAHQAMSSVEHLYWNIAVIRNWLANAPLNTFNESMRKLLHLLVGHTRTFITQCEIYMVAATPLLVMLKRYSDHNSLINSKIYNDLRQLTRVYDEMLSICDSVLPTLYSNNDDMFYDDEVFFGLDDTHAPYVVKNQPAPRHVVFGDAEAKKKLAEPVGTTADDEEEKENKSDDESDFDSDDDGEARENQKIFEDKVSQFANLTLRGKKVFGRHASKIRRLFTNRRALIGLRKACDCFKNNLGEDRWKSYVLQKDIPYQNRPIWKVCHLLSCRRLKDLIGRIHAVEMDVDSDSSRHSALSEDSKYSLQAYAAEFNNAVKDLGARCSAVEDLQTAAMQEYYDLLKYFDGTHSVDHTSGGSNSIRDQFTHLNDHQFWDHSFFDDFPNLRNLAVTVFNAPPIVTAVDSFFSVTKTIANQRRLITADPNNPVLHQCYLHVNGDYTRSNVHRPWFFCDRSTTKERRALLAERTKKSEAEVEPASPQKVAADAAVSPKTSSTAKKKKKL